MFDCVCAREGEREKKNVDVGVYICECLYAYVRL